MAEPPAPVPGWLRLLERPRRLHRLATGGLMLAALISAADSFARSTPGGPRQDVQALTFLLDALAWALVAASAVAEAFVAGTSAARIRSGGRPHYLIVLVLGLGIAGVLCLTLSFYAASPPGELGTAGRIFKAVVAGMLPLVVGVALTAGLTILWVERLRPRLEARLEAEVRDYERRRQRGA